MNEKVFEKLEFDKILLMLSERALSEPGREAALKLRPQKTIAGVKRLQSETLEAESILMREPSMPMSSFSDISSEVLRLKTGADLGCRELLRVLGVMKAARRAKSGIKRQDTGTNILPDMAEALFFSLQLITELDTAIASEETLSDAASPELLSIRKKIIRENEGIREKLDAIIRSSQEQRLPAGRDSNHEKRALRSARKAGI